MSTSATNDALEGVHNPGGHRQRQPSVDSDANAEETAYYKHAAAPQDYLPVSTVEAPEEQHPSVIERLTGASMKRRAKMSAARDSRFVHRERQSVPTTDTQGGLAPSTAATDMDDFASEQRWNGPGASHDSQPQGQDGHTSASANSLTVAPAMGRDGNGRVQFFPYTKIYPTFGKSEYKERHYRQREYTETEVMSIYRELDNLHNELFPDDHVPTLPLTVTSASDPLLQIRPKYLTPQVPIKEVSFWKRCFGL